MKIYTREESVPAIAIVLATRDDSVQPILFTSQYGNTDSYTDGENNWNGRRLQWVVNYAKITILRDWSTSQAQITLTTPLPDRSDFIPQLPDISAMRGGDYPFLSEEDEIRVYMGYVQTRSTPITADMLDEYPCDYVTPEYAAALSLELDKLPVPAWTQDPCKPMCPVFWGFIDTVNLTGSSKGGVQITILCRDRTRVFSNTRLVSIQSLLGKTKKGALGLRDVIVKDIAKAATGQLFSTDDAARDSATQIKAWKDIDTDLLTNVTWKDQDGQSDTLTGGVKDTAAWEEDPSLWTRMANLSVMSPTASPRFHIWLRRPPLNKSHGAQIFNSINVNPLEVLGFLARSEERVTDFYASHVNGDFIIGPRVLDTSGFYDPLRMYRTYFFKQWPCGYPPPPDNQKIISIRVLSSSVATFNRYVVSSSEPNGTSQSFINGIQVVLTTSPYKYRNRKVSPPCRTQIIVDGNLTSYDNPTGGAIALALATAQGFGRDSQGVEFKVIGDPTLYPGEAVRVYNTILHDYKAQTHSGTKEGIAETKEQVDRLTGLGYDKTIKQGRGVVLQEGKNDYADLLSLGGTETDKDNFVLPVYMIRNIQHIFSAQNEDGFTTRIRAAANYNL